MIDEKEFKSRFVEEVNKGIDVIANMDTVIERVEECWGFYRKYASWCTPEEWAQEEMRERDNATDRQEDG